MQGRIVAYSDRTGRGRIVASNDEEYGFSKEEWHEGNESPTVGRSVIFRKSGTRALDVKLASGSGGTESAPPHPSPNVPEPTMDVDTCLRIHFSDILTTVAEYGALLEERHRLDFVRMQRFFVTAYNNLIEIDHDFENRKLLELKSELFGIHRLFRTFENDTRYVQNAYEEVFLSRQVRYKELRTRIRRNKIRISELENIAKRTEEALERETRRLERSERGSEAYDTLAAAVKTLKRTMVDAIHEMAELTEENRLHTGMLERFRKAHYETFKAGFDKFVGEQTHLLRKIQDVLAYRLDAAMWEKANRSRPIQTFFLQAGITDEFSATTYLKYYLKGLDSSKLNRRNRELSELLHYLEGRTKTKVVCIDDDMEFVALVRSALGEIDREIKVISTPSAKAILPRLGSIRPEMILIDPRTRNVDLETFLEYARKTVPDLQTIFCTGKIDRALLKRAKHLGVQAIVPKKVGKRALIERLDRYIT
ncbi:response regulator [Hydrogenimonas sp.]